MRKKELEPIEFEEQTGVTRTLAGFDLFVLIRLGVAAICFVVGLLFPAEGIVRLALMLASFLAAGYDVLMDALNRILRERVMDENLLIIIATLAAFVLSLDSEGAAIMLFFRLGKLGLEYVRRRSEEGLFSSLDPSPSTATVLVDEVETSVDVDSIRPGDTLILHPGDCAPVDCVVLEGYTAVDMSAVTGDSRPRSVEEGDTVPAGSVNITSLIHAEAIVSASMSTLNRIRETIADDGGERSDLEELADKYLRLFAPVSLALCAVVAVLLTFFAHLTVGQAIHRAMVLLIIVSPGGALAGLALSYFTGLTGAANQGVLLKGNAVLENLARCKAVIFDKDGTISTGGYGVDSVDSPHMDAGILLKAAAHAAANASSASARAIVSAYGGAIDYSVISNFTEYHEGIRVDIEGIGVLMGSLDFLIDSGVDVENALEAEEPAMHIALGGRYAAVIRFNDILQEQAPLAVSLLEELNMEDIILLSADSIDKTRSLAHMSGIAKYYSRCLPMDKLSRVQEMCERTRGSGTLYVGSALTDSAMLSAADVGMILGGFDAGENGKISDVLALDNNVYKVPLAVGAARKTARVCREGLVFVLGVKALLLLLGLFGVTNALWFTALVDACAGIGCALNAVRAFPVKK
ncbi:MAG: HAD family hydrolase [Ruminococcaceae bacterium]|nr:HAD family hydrolase [Oscillospiraceae bacterium]